MHSLVVLKLQYALETPGGFVKTQSAGPTPRVPGSVGLGWGPRICIFKYPGDAEAGLGAIL